MVVCTSGYSIQGAQSDRVSVRWEATWLQRGAQSLEDGRGPGAIAPQLRVRIRKCWCSSRSHSAVVLRLRSPLPQSPECQDCWCAHTSFSVLVWATWQCWVLCVEEKEGTSQVTLVP